MNNVLGLSDLFPTVRLWPFSNYVLRISTDIFDYFDYHNQGTQIVASGYLAVQTLIDIWHYFLYIRWFFSDLWIKQIIRNVSECNRNSFPKETVLLLQMLLFLFLQISSSRIDSHLLFQMDHFSRQQCDLLIVRLCKL